MTQPVVSNAGPLLALAKLNILHLLKRLYDRVYIPQAVYEETIVVGLRRGYEDAHILKLFLKQADWVPTTVSVPSEIGTLRLDRGEQESLALAQSLEALILIDEERGRMRAREFGLTVLGTLGILVTAYREGMIETDQLRFYLGQITSRDDIWISPTLCLRVLDEVIE
ncbi:MAG: hypothetical protein ACP5JG_12825 [Anaerolineae bacterium]